MDDKIVINEVMNEGREVHVYFNNMTGLNIAFGQSAYIVSKYVPDAMLSYSPQLQMPVVQLTKEQTQKLFDVLHVVKDAKQGHVLIELTESIDNEGYMDWAGKLREDG